MPILSNFPAGGVVTVNDILPDDYGKITLEAFQIEALSTKGGDMNGSINMYGTSESGPSNIYMNGNKIYGLSTPENDSEAANKSYVDTTVNNAKPVAVTVTLTDNGWGADDT